MKCALVKSRKKLNLGHDHKINENGVQGSQELYLMMVNSACLLDIVGFSSDCSNETISLRIKC